MQVEVVLLYTLIKVTIDPSPTMHLTPDTPNHPAAQKPYLIHLKITDLCAIDPNYAVMYHEINNCHELSRYNSGSEFRTR
jgi:hypothetical protein